MYFGTNQLLMILYMSLVRNISSFHTFLALTSRIVSYFLKEAVVQINRTGSRKML